MGDESRVRLECGTAVSATHRLALERLPSGTGISVRIRWSATRCLGDVAWLISIGRQNNRAWRREVGSVECNDPLVTEVVFEAADLAEVLPWGPHGLFVTREADSPKDTCLGSVFIEGVDVFALGESTPLAAVASEVHWTNDDARGPRETVYDEQISPLMKKIIAICKANGIPMLADFALDGDMPCTTSILREEDNPPKRFHDAYVVLRPDKRAPLMVTTRDGEGRVTGMTAIV